MDDHPLRRIYRPISETEYWLLHDILCEGADPYTGQGTRPWRTLSASGMIDRHNGGTTTLGRVAYDVAHTTSPYPGRLSSSGAVALAYGPGALIPLVRRRVLATLAASGLWDADVNEPTRAGHDIVLIFLVGGLLDPLPETVPR